jgi:hypothetical protein
VEPSKVDDSKGLYPKYVVFNHPEEDAENLIGEYYGSDGRYHAMISVKDFCFVLKPSKDYHARVAMAAYAESVRHWNPQLAEDLDDALDLAQTMTPRMEPT